MNSNTTLTMLNLHQKIPKGATTKSRVKRYTYKRDKIVDIPVERIALDMQDQRSNPGHTMMLHTNNPRPMSLPNINFLHCTVSEILPGQNFKGQGHYGKVKCQIKVTMTFYIYTT